MLHKECPEQGLHFGLRLSLSVKPLDVQGPPDPQFTLAFITILASSYSAAPKLSTLMTVGSLEWGW